MAKAAFIRKVLCFEVFKILFGQLVDRMLENKSLHELEAPPLAGECASGTYFWPVKNGPLPAELKFRENTELPSLFASDDDQIVSHDAPRFMLYYHCVRRHIMISILCLRFSYLAPYFLISGNTITFHKYFWCSWFCKFHSKNSLFPTFNYCRSNTKPFSSGENCEISEDQYHLRFYFIVCFTIAE